MAEAIVRGQQSTEVAHLQRLLASSGQRMVIDGVYGPRTQAAVASFLRSHGGTGTGARVDAELLDRLEQATMAVGAEARGRAVGALESAEPATSSPTIDRPSGDLVSSGVPAETRAFARLICSRRTSAPLSIGLFGDGGSGKSFFMGKLQGEIEARCAAFTRVATALAAQADDAGLIALQDRWHGRVAQITFNAWHFAEPNLWASLVTRVFDELASLISPAESPEDTRARLLAEASESKQRREQAKLELRRAEEQLAEARVERERREAELAELRKELGVVEAMAPKSEATTGEATTGEATAGNVEAQLGVRSPWAALRVTLRWVWSRGRWSRVALIAAVVLLVLGSLLAVAWWRNWWSDWLTPGIAAATTGVGLCTGVVSTLGTWWFVIQPRLEQARATQAIYLDKRASAQGFVDRALRDLLRSSEGPATLARRRLEEAEVGLDSAKMATEQANEHMARAMRMVQELGGGRRFYAFVQDRDDDDDYRRHLGLVSMVRDDFQRLEQILAQVEREGPGDGELAPLSRIVLYIDDLDRCSPVRVVEVLQALNLLLSTSIFVVVLAADAGWLRRSLDLHLRHLLHVNHSDTERPHEDSIDPAPWSELEKTFQIPFSLRPIDAEGFASMVQVAARPALHPGRADLGASLGPPEQEADLALDATLALEPVEVHLIERLYAVMARPSLVTALLASYRLLRAEIDPEALPAYLSEGSYRGVLTLLAIGMGRAEDAALLFPALHQAREASPTTLGELLLGLGRESGSDLRNARWQALSSALARAGVADTSVAELTPWTDRVRRFSFDPWPHD